MINYIFKKAFCFFTVFMILNMQGPVGLVLNAVCKTSVPQQGAYDQFPEMRCALTDLETTAKWLSEKDLHEAKKLSKELDRRVDEDPEFKKLSCSDADKYGEREKHGHKPYNHNRLGRDNPLIYLGASEVHTEQQDFILASCPKTPEEFVGVLSCFLEKVTSHGVWVSLLSSHEAQKYCNNFWKEKFLKQLTLPQGWFIRKVSSSIIGGSRDKSGPSLTKTTIKIWCGSTSKTIIHYHYDKWLDRTVLPNEELFLLLLDEMEAHTEKKAPIVINCIGGVGRTGMTTVAYILRKEIRGSLSRGVLPNKCFVNIPEMVYALRKQRAHLMDNPEHLYKIHSVLAKYYKKLVSKKPHSHSAEK